MENVELKCQHCGGSFVCENGIDEYSCPYCGNKVIADMRPAMLGIKSATKLLEKRQEHKAREAELKHVEAEAQRKDAKFYIVVLLAICIVGFVVLAIVGADDDSEGESGSRPTEAAAETAVSSKEANVLTAADADRHDDLGQSAGDAKTESSEQTVETREYVEISAEDIPKLSAGKAIEFTGIARFVSSKDANLAIDGHTYYVEVKGDFANNADRYYVEARYLDDASCSAMLAKGKPFDLKNPRVTVRGVVSEVVRGTETDSVVGVVLGPGAIANFAESAAEN